MDELTVTQIFQEVLRTHWMPQIRLLEGFPPRDPPRWSKEVEYSFKRRIEPVFGDLLLSQINLKALRLWHQSQNLHPAAANQALTVLSTLFQYAIDNEWRAQNTNLCKLVKKFPTRKRKRFATMGEIARIGQFLDQEPPRNFVACCFIKLLLLTGCRPSSLENAKWVHLKENGRVLELQGKTGIDTIHLSVEAQKIIQSLPKVSDKILGIKMPRRLWSRVKKTVGVPDLWARDLRRTYATIGLSNGVSIGVIGELLNHKSTQTTKIYAKLMDTTGRDSVEIISNEIKRILG